MITWGGAVYKGGHVFSACNIENAVYTPGIRVERTVFSKAVREGEQAFWAIVDGRKEKNGYRTALRGMQVMIETECQKNKYEC